MHSWSFSLPFPSSSPDCSLCSSFFLFLFLTLHFPVISSLLSSLPPFLITPFTPSCCCNPPMYICGERRSISLKCRFCFLVPLSLSFLLVLCVSQSFQHSTCLSSLFSYPAPCFFPLLFYLFLVSLALSLSASLLSAPLHLLSPAEKNRGVFWRRARANTDIQPAPLTALSFHWQLSITKHTM